ncbi:hypothetical protein F4802DRAFT_291939 [Xylaria palmicola]|nr:hypothetical protein F4802DRAFT_291939 [Xylaria palmicola]
MTQSSFFLLTRLGVPCMADASIQIQGPGSLDLPPRPTRTNPRKSGVETPGLAGTPFNGPPSSLLGLYTQSICQAHPVN